MQFIEASNLSHTQQQEVFELWNNEYPKNLIFKSLLDFNVYLDELSDKSYIIMIDQNQCTKGWYVQFSREGEKWFVLIIDCKYQGKGFGSEFMNLAKARKIELNGWVIDHNKDVKSNGEIYKSPLKFYLKNGFKVLKSKRLEIKKISAVKIHWND